MIRNQTRSNRRFVTELAQMQGKPILFVDSDGVVTRRGSAPNDRPPGAFDNVDGVMHFLSEDAGIHLLALGERVACSGWEQRAEEDRPRVLPLPGGRPFLSFERDPGATP